MQMIIKNPLTVRRPEAGYVRPLATIPTTDLAYQKPFCGYHKVVHMVCSTEREDRDEVRVITVQRETYCPKCRAERMMNGYTKVKTIYKVP